MPQAITGALVIIACALAAAPVPAALTDPTARLTTAHSDRYGTYLADAEGRALYLFTPDKPRTREAAIGSTCYGPCARAWPPVVARELPQLSARLDSSLLGTVRRPDGTLQVTYNGWPLYYYAADRGPGSAAGQDIHSFGGGWYLVGPDGDKIEKKG